ncbi:MAG TPA: zinc ribbon domain-containing protein [Dehalococcoidia bacterium]|nr:zinc ribbon domain-containing protein [Dehalococcoidia bacterium]
MATCPICGTKVSEDAGFCPKCLRRLMTGQATKGKSKKKLVGIIVACVIAISVVIVITTHLPKVPSGGVAELEYVAVSAYDFAKELFDPELTSLQREYLWKNYEGKQAEWTNELKYVSTKKEGLIAYFLNPLDWARTEVEAIFDESQMSSLLQLEEGDLVTYTGVLASFGGTEIRLTDCTVVSLPIVPLWWNDDIDTHSKRILVGDEVLCLGPSTYDDATEYLPRLLPKITAIDRERGELLWEGEKTESVLVGIDSRYAYAWHSVRVVPMFEPDYPRYWFASNITALDRVSGEIGWYSYLSEGVRCLQQNECLPDEWSESDFVNCCILKGRVKEEITNEGEPGLTFLIDKPPLSEITYEYQGVIYRSACAVYGGIGRECGALQALDQQTGDVLWMMTFRETGMNDFSIVDGILYVSTDEGVGAFKL